MLHRHREDIICLSFDLGNVSHEWCWKLIDKRFRSPRIIKIEKLSRSDVITDGIKAVPN